MNFVMYKDEIHVLVSQENDKATIAGFKLFWHGDSWLVYEIDVDQSELDVAPIVHQRSMIYRLYQYLLTHTDVLGFSEKELDLIHNF